MVFDEAADISFPRMSEAEMFNFSPDAQQVFVQARKEAIRLNHNFFGSGHLLLGLLAVEHGMAVKVLKTMGADTSAIRQEVEKQIVVEPNQAVTGIFPDTPRVKKIIALAMEEARGLGSPLVDTEHLLVGILRGDDGEAGKVLRDFKVDIIQLRQEILKLAGLPPATPAKSIFGRRRSFFELILAEVQYSRPTAGATCGFTPYALRVFVQSITEADRFNHNFVCTEHLLLGLVQMREGGAVTILRKLGLNLETIHRELEISVGSEPDDKALGTLPYTPRVKKVISLAREEAKNLNRSRIGTEHLLLGLLREGDGAAAMFLRNLNVDSDQVRQMVLSGLDPNFSDQLPTEDSIERIDTPGYSPVVGPANNQVIQPAEEAGGFKRPAPEMAGFAVSFTPRAQQVLALARKEADRFNHNFLGTEHLLLGLIKLGQGVAATVLQNLGLSLESVRTEVERWAGDQKTVGNIPYTLRVKEVISFAQEEAKRLNHTYVGTEHLLLGLLRDGDGPAAKIFNTFKVNAEQTYRGILKELKPRV